ncbi:MAG: oligosaccharide flippase family protein [Clostridiales bacterium]|nr:oligosaccharide flippase family protein [Clostridiales bacterium]
MSETKSGKKLLVGTGIYAVGTFGTKILMFLIAPLYTYYLATSEMGTYDVLISTIGLLIPIISMQISDAVYRWIIRENVDSEAYLRVTYQFLLVSSLLCSGIILAVHFLIVTIPYIWYFLGALLSSLFFQISQKILRGLKRQWIFAISGIIYTCVFLGLNIVQLCVLHRGVESLLMSYITANIVGLAAIVAAEKRIRVNIFRKAEPGLLKELLGFSIPLIPNYLSWWIVDSSDRYIVLWFLGVSANGVLAIAHKFPTILQSVFGLFLNSWQDLAIASEQYEKAFFTNVFRRLYRLAFMLLWVLIPATKLFVWLVMGQDYKIACDYIPFYYLGAVFQAFCSFYGVGYLRSKNTKGSFSSSIWGALINASVNIGLIRIIGLQAAAVSTFFSFLGMWLIREKQNREELGITIRWPEFLLFLAVGIAVCLVSIFSSIRFNIALSAVGIDLFLILNYKDMEIIAAKLKNRKKAKASSGQV